MAVACWSIIYVARALEWWRIYWNTFWFEHCVMFTRTERTNAGMVVHFVTKPGLALLVCFAWCYPAAVGLTKIANRGLPVLPDDAGFLSRLYPSRPA
jgi:hypothetical protein